MVKVCILNNLKYSFNSIDEFNNIKNNIINDLIFTDIKQNNNNKLLQDIIYLMLNFCDNKSNNINKSNIINTYHISKNYYLFTFYFPNNINNNNNNNNNDYLLNYLIDNAIQDNYDENNKFYHNNIGCIIKIKNNLLDDVNNIKIIKLIKYSNLHKSYLISSNNIIKTYYTNNPIFNYPDYNMYITNTFLNNEIRIHFKFDEEIKFINYKDSLDLNKKLIHNIINKYHIFKDKKDFEYPLNTNIIISLHNNNKNININKKIFNKIYNFINN